VRRSGEIFQLFGKESKRIRRLAIPTFAEVDSSLARGYFLDVNRLILSVFRFSRDNYTPALPINSLPGAQRRDTRRKKRRDG